MNAKTAIQPTREDDFPEWYQQVLKAADLAEHSPVRGAMIIKPWGYAIWENLQKKLDQRIKEKKYDNAYFPLFIPLSFFEKEASHVKGFAKECAVVTHSRLIEKDGKLIPTSALEEPLIVRPTSETIIGDAFSKWVHSYRDLPLRINQWANIVRWEMRPRLFLRTTEILWQEGHSVHASAEEAKKESIEMLHMYQNFLEKELAIPVIVGEKSEGERFPGALGTFTMEAIMQDCKALQAGTSHYLGQNFAKAANIQFSTEEGDLQFGHTTSWGVTTRLIGATIMVHSDDNGLRLPPSIAPKQVVIVPVIPKPEQRTQILQYCQHIEKELSQIPNIRILLDDRDMRGGEKNWEWIKKGVPIRLEIGPKDLEKKAVVLYRRDKQPKEKEFVTEQNLKNSVEKILEEIQQSLWSQAKNFLKKSIRDDITTLDEMKQFFTPKNRKKPEIHGGFVLAKWCEDPQTEDFLKDLQVTIRCLPFEQSNTQGTCILTGKPATKDVIFAKAY